METFVVRLWRGIEGDDELRGVVRHVSSGSEQRFSSARELEAALRGPAVAGASGPTSHRGPAPTTGRMARGEQR